jgi:hypothetical protein
MTVQGALLALTALTTSLAINAAPSEKDVLKRAAAYVESQIELFPQLVAEERSSQTLRLRVTRSMSPPPRVIQTRGDMAWIRFDGLPEAIGVRDIREVDGKPVGGEERLEDLLRRPTASSIAAARALLAESARYNLGPLWRNVNLPTTALFLLHRSLQPRFSWKVERSEGPGGVMLSFKEREQPTVIRGFNNEPVFSRGRIWIDPATGAVQRTELHTEASDPEERKTFYQLVVEFAIDDTLQLLLPRHLREHYETQSEVVDGRAEYTNYRRFRTEGRLVR